MAFISGRKCELGWGYDESLNRLIPITGDPPNAKFELYDSRFYCAYDLSCDYIRFFDLSHEFTILLNPKWKQFLNYSIVLDDREYWELQFCITRQRGSCDRHKEYPLNCSHFVNKIQYGVELWAIFPKIGFPERNRQVEELFREEILDETQKQVKCRVLVNFNKTWEMSAGQLLEFIKEIEDEKHTDLHNPVCFWYKKLKEKCRRTKINNENDFGKFLKYLDAVYRKIEMKQERAGYQQTLPELISTQESFVSICGQLLRAKKAFKSMNRNDFLNMHLVLKKLLFWYMEYLKCSITYGSDIDEGNFLPGTVDELKSWLRQLNTWFPIKINGKWMNCMGQFIGTPKGCEEFIRKLYKTTKFSNWQLITDEEATEPYIRKENKEIIFGLVNMEGADESETPKDAKVFEWECPEKCTMDLRKWICTKCGEFVFQRDMILYCSNGSKKYSDKLLICPHPSHRSQLAEKRGTQEYMYSPTPNTNGGIYHSESFQSVFNPGSLKRIN